MDANKLQVTEWAQDYGPYYMAARENSQSPWLRFLLMGGIAIWASEFFIPVAMLSFGWSMITKKHWGLGVSRYWFAQGWLQRNSELEES